MNPGYGLDTMSGMALAIGNCDIMSRFTAHKN